jgi:uncharacterized protein (TIGR02680 family)
MPDSLTIVPTVDRWQPTRAGLVGLWRYAEETFTFHRGRLLLRGPNGSGKSMALELLLPFLLDGDTSPSRLTSAAKSRGRLYDRMMAGTDDLTPTGFAWAEFRRGEDVFTVGARLRASQSTGKVDAAFFTTTLAVGSDLFLLDDTRTPLSKHALVEAIGDDGRVHATADEHRTAIREKLFPGFSADRYASVINALLALRKEKLSQNLDPDKLSSVLSDALPPLDDQDVAVLAEGFERLDRRRCELAALERDLEEVKALARQQREYARAVVVGTARDVRSAESRRDGVTRAEREAREALEAADSRAREVADERTTLEARTDAIGVEIEALKDSDAYRAGAGLADLRRLSDSARSHADHTARYAADREQDHVHAQRDAETATGERETAASNRDLAEREVRAAAEPVGADAVAEDACARPDPDEGDRLARAWTRTQRGRIDEIHGFLDAHEEAVRRRGFFDDELARQEQLVDERQLAQQAADTQLTSAVSAYSRSVDEWVLGCEHAGSALAAAISRPAQDPAAVHDAVARVSTRFREALARARQVLETQQQQAETDRAVHLTERSRWEHGELVDPDAAPWRSDRTGRPGAPFWRLVDVAADVDEAVVNGLEAALTGAGLIDAWVRPDGAVDLGADAADVLFTIRRSVDRSVADVLVPAADGAVSAEVVRQILQSLSLTDTVAADSDSGPEVLFGRDGSYRLGAAIGRGPRRPALLLGAVARERHRLQRLAEIDAAIADIDARLAQLTRGFADLDRQQAAQEAELAAEPSGAPVETAIRELAHAQTRLSDARQQVETVRARRAEAEDAVRATLRELTALAARHGLPSDRAALAELQDRLTKFDQAMATWTRRAREMQAAARQEDQARVRAERAAAAAQQARADHEAAAQEATQTAQRLAILEATVGAEYAEIVSQVTEREQERTANRQRAASLASEERDLLGRAGELREKVDVATRARAEAEQERDRTHSRLVAAVTDVAADAGIAVTEGLDTATAVLAAARSISADHEKLDIDDQAIQKLSGRVNDRIHQAQTALGARVDFDREFADAGWWVLRTTTAGVRRRIGDLTGFLSSSLTAGKGELAADEEALFERTLAGGVRRALADRIRQANALTDAINHQLSGVRTAAGGVQVRLKWEVDPEQPTAVRSARQLLLRDPADLSAAERASLQEFVRARVDQARAELEANAPWEARLRETLDYRSWHRFTLQVAHRDTEGFQPATTKRLASLSTGERSIVLHLPMIASVAAHYSGSETASVCPRLILLDELFAGVDVPNRAQLFGTFTDWDLDAVFTSDSEWCQYRTLDGIAIHHLHPPASDHDPVTSTRFTWDGHVKLMDPAA